MKILDSEKGVAIYLSLMVMMILLAIGLGVSTIIISQINTTRGMGDSVVAFYAADTGIEKTIFYDNKVIPPTGNRGLCYICGSCADCLYCSTNGTDCDPLNCIDCTISYYTNFNEKRYNVEATVSGGVTTIKSKGIYKETQRAVEITR